MLLLENLDATPFLMVLAWWYMRKNFVSKAEQNGISASNKHMMYLVLLSNMLQMYYYFIVMTIIVVLCMYLFKLLLLEQVAELSNGKYPFSVEAAIRNKFLKMFSNKAHMVFAMIAFAVINVFLYVMVMFVLSDESDTQTKVNQMTLVLDMILAVFIICYSVFISTYLAK